MALSPDNLPARVRAAIFAEACPSCSQTVQATCPRCSGSVPGEVAKDPKTGYVYCLACGVSRPRQTALFASE